MSKFATGITLDHSEFFEIVGDLYYKRFGRLRPGKLEPMGLESSCSNENAKQFDEWTESGQYYRDAIQEISDLKERIEELQDE